MLIVLIVFNWLSEVMGPYLLIALMDSMGAYEWWSCFGFDVMNSYSFLLIYNLMIVLSWSYDLSCWYACWLDYTWHCWSCDVHGLDIRDNCLLICISSWMCIMWFEIKLACFNEMYIFIMIICCMCIWFHTYYKWCASPISIFFPQHFSFAHWRVCDVFWSKAWNRCPSVGMSSSFEDDAFILL